MIFGSAHGSSASPRHLSRLISNHQTLISNLQHLIQDPVIRLIDLLQVEIAVGFLDGGQVFVVQLGVAGQRVAVGGDEDVVDLFFGGLAVAQVSFLVGQRYAADVVRVGYHGVSHGVVGQHLVDKGQRVQEAC